MNPPIESVLDLIGHYPRRYHDRTRQSEIAELEVGEEATIVAEVQRISSRVTRNRKKMVEAVVEDGSGLLNLVFFNQPWREKQLPTGTEVALVRQARRVPRQAPDDQPGRRHSREEPATRRPAW